MSETEIVNVRTRNDLSEFVNLPWSIYHTNDNWVPPLKKDIRRLLDTRKHPFWKTASRELFIAKTDGKTVGRIAAIVDTNYNQYHQEKMGVWGFFECVDNLTIARLLLSRAEKWTKTQGMEFIRGPLNPSTNYEVGLLVEGFDHIPTIMMPWNFPYYSKLVEAAGHSKEKDLFTFRVYQTDPAGPRIERLGKRVLSKGHISIRNISRKNYDSEIRLLASIYNQAWADNWGFAPMTDSEVDEMAQNLKRIFEEDLVFFILHDGQPVGVVMVMPDMNPLLRQANGRIGLITAIKFLLRRRLTVGLGAAMGGILKEYKRLGAPLVVFHHLNTLFRGHKQIQFLECGWNLEDNKDINDLEVEMGAKRFSVYRIFRKDLI